MLAMLFVFSLAPCAAELAGHHRFFVFNRVVSASCTVYLVLTLAYHASQQGFLSDLISMWRRKPRTAHLPLAR